MTEKTPDLSAYAVFGLGEKERATIVANIREHFRVLETNGHSFYFRALFSPKLNSPTAHLTQDEVLARYVDREIAAHADRAEDLRRYFANQPPPALDAIASQSWFQPQLRHTIQNTLRLGGPYGVVKLWPLDLEAILAVFYGRRMGIKPTQILVLAELYNATQGFARVGEPARPARSTPAANQKDKLQS